MDNLAIHTAKLPHETEEQHRSWHQGYMHQILDKLEENDLYLKPEKCEFKQDEIEYLGVIVGKNRLQMHPKKLQGIADWSPP
jgi:CCR4-NOT transcriptional regulation complex NOT5 subunit